MRDVVVTGLGILLPGCDSREQLWTQLSSGTSQLEFIADPSDPDTRCAVGRVAPFDPSEVLPDIPDKFLRRYPRELLLYLVSLSRSLEDAGLAWDGVDLERVGLFDGASRPTLAFWYDRILNTAQMPVREAFGRRDLLTCIPGQTVGIAASLYKVRGPTYMVNATCSSGAVSIGHAYREICAGRIDVGFATGHEAALVAPLFAMYRDAGLISREQEDPGRAVAPYVDHSTNAFGEGAVTLVLESRDHAVARGARILANFRGYRHANSGYHPTSIDVVGVRSTEIIRDALAETGCGPDDVSFLVGHGNGVGLSDTSEENFMRRLFQARAAHVPLVSVKPIYGHSLGASSATNAAAAVMMAHHGRAIPTLNVDPERTKRFAQHDGTGQRADGIGVATSYGMGGQNAVLLFSK